MDLLIDVGHGGSAAHGKSTPYGGRGPSGSTEKAVALRLAETLAEELSDLSVGLTRRDDRNLSLAERAQLARS